VAALPRRYPIDLSERKDWDSLNNAILGLFHLDDEIKRFLPDTGTSGRRAESLVKVDGLSVILVTMNAGARLHEHTAPGPITIQPIRGTFTVSVGGESHVVATGGLISIAFGERHAVEAVDSGAFLLTISGLSGRFVVR